MVGKVWAPSAAAWAAGLLIASGCAEGTQPLLRREELSTGGEVFHILCKRVAAADHPSELTGVRFNAPCDGKGPVPSDVDEESRFAAMVAHREELVAALDQVFGDKDAMGSVTFESGELDAFLANLIPFYDVPDEWIPDSTRALEKIMGELLSERGEPVIKALARIAPRVGYRPLKQVLGVVRPSLSYPRIDELTRQFLKLVTQGGSAYPAFTDLLKAGALELAEPKDPAAPAPADSTLRTTMDLLLASDPAFAPESDPALWVVKRDDTGVALPADGATLGKTPASPFARSSSEKKNRDDAGRAVDGDALLYQYVDANRTLLGGLLREQYTLLKRDGDKSTVEKLVRGLRVVMGPTVERTENFGSKAALKFKGPDVENGPLFDLVHAASALARYPETDDLLNVLNVLMKEHESDAAAPVYAGLRIDEISDEFPNAKLIGQDGEGTPNEFWDDLIGVGLRMLERPGQLEAVIKSFADPQSVASTQLIAKFMRYKDQVSYNGAPIAITNGKYSDADATKMNSEVVHTFSQEVAREMAGGDLGTNLDMGMNRSLFQRLISTIHATNNVPNCNKEGALLSVRDPTTAAIIAPGALLIFPDPTHKPTNNSPLEGAARLVIDSGDCKYQSGDPTGSYKLCEFVKQPNGAEAHMRAILDLRSEVRLKDPQLHCLDEHGLAGDLDATQERETQFKGFTLKPSATAIARYIHVPRNKFTSDLFAPFATKHGVSVAEFEPDILFSLEMKQPDVKFNNAPQSFLTASRPLGFAFDDHEFFEDTEDGKVATHGYMFAELLSTLHMHWPSRRAADFRCPAAVKKGDEGCSQSGDPSAKFYAYQSNLVSYEPLLIRALQDEKLGEILQKANATLGTIKITGADGKQRDGIEVLTNFARRILTADETLAYRDGRKYSHSNRCEPVESSGMNGEVVAECMDGKGRIIPGKGVMPLYLLLDALKGIDKSFEGDNAERHEPWLAARSALVDQFLAVSKDETNASAVTYALSNRRAYATTLQLIPWLRARIAAHRDAGDLTEWADGLTGRLAGVLGHPVTAAALDLLDVLWSEDKAGEEFAKLNAYLMDAENNPTAFQGLVTAALDTLFLIDRDSELTPVFQFASLGLAPNALELMEGGNNGGKDLPNIEESAAMTALELTKRITDVYPDSDSTPLSRLLKNGVLADGEGLSPLEEFIDSSAEVNRKDPADPREKPMTAEDYRATFEQIRMFLNDQDRGLERLYKVIQGRDLSKKAN